MKLTDKSKNVSSCLQFSLKSKWFEMTKMGIKKEDYRELTPYWCSRLMTFDGEHKPQSFWINIASGFAKGYFYHRVDFKKYQINKMTLGYPKSTDEEKILKLEHKGIEIRTGNTEWGAEENKIYIVIIHGAILV